MSENYGWNYFENEVVIGDKQDKKRMIVLVFSNFMCIPYNRKSFDELVDWLNKQQDAIEAKDKEIEESKITIQLYETDVSMRDNFLKSKGLYDEFLQCLKEGGIIE